MPFHAFHIVCARLSRYGYAGLFDSLPEDPRYTPIEILKAAKGTEAMPSGYECAKKLIEAFPRLLERKAVAMRIFESFSALNISFGKQEINL